MALERVSSCTKDQGGRDSCTSGPRFLSVGFKGPGRARSSLMALFVASGPAKLTSYERCGSFRLQPRNF